MKNLKPTSSHFLSQAFWRNLRKILNKNLWTFFYRLSQKLKIRGLISKFKGNKYELKRKFKLSTF